MSSRDLAARIGRRAARAGLSVPAPTAAGLESYFALLARWNARINLTALDVASSSDAAIDRLLIEPLLAARRITADENVILDVGSGGGSPAIPLKLALPRLRLTMVESKVRKSAFLREVMRQLDLQDVEVANCRLEELLSRSDLHEACDVISVRAVKGDARLWQHMLPFLKVGGRVFWFRTAGPPADPGRVPLVAEGPDVPTVAGGVVTLLRKAARAD